MSTSAAYPRLNIYLDSDELRRQIKVAAAHAGVSLSTYCLEAIRARLVSEAPPVAPTPGAAEAEASTRPVSAVETARALDQLRREIGPIGIPVAELIREGRRR